jgi:hypothetical protein
MNFSTFSFLCDVNKIPHKFLVIVAHPVDFSKTEKKGIKIFTTFVGFVFVVLLNISLKVFTS